MSKLASRVHKLEATAEEEMRKATVVAGTQLLNGLPSVEKEAFFRLFEDLTDEEAEALVNTIDAIVGWGPPVTEEITALAALPAARILEEATPQAQELLSPILEEVTKSAER